MINSDLFKTVETNVEPTFFLTQANIILQTHIWGNFDLPTHKNIHLIE